MCGRFVSVSSTEVLTARFGIDEVSAERPPSHNVAPSQEVPALIDDAGRRRLGLLRWGYVPSWSDDPTRGVRPINARAEGAAGSRMFRDALARRRCAVPMDGWYEWCEDRDGGPKHAFHLALTAPGPFAVAALRSVWRGGDAGPALHTVALLTTAARGRAADVHDRMPLVVPDHLLDDWLAIGTGDPARLIGALVAAEHDVVVHEVSTRVNRVGNDGPDLVRPLDGPLAGPGAGPGAGAIAAPTDERHGRDGARPGGGASGGADR